MITLALVGVALAFALSFGAATAWRVVSDAGEPEQRAVTTANGAPAPGDVPASTKSPRLHVPEVEIDAPVVPVPLRDGVLDPPAAVSRVGWWKDSAGVDDEVGQTVLTGHTVHGGGGVMDDLDALQPGDMVHLTNREGRVDYQVTQVVTWPKQKVARHAVDLFGQDRHHGRLVLVTCEDWTDDDYASNVIVLADKVTDGPA